MSNIVRAPSLLSVRSLGGGGKPIVPPRRHKSLSSILCGGVKSYFGSKRIVPSCTFVKGGK